MIARRRVVLVAVAVLLYLGAAWLLLWSITSAQMNFLACPDGFTLWSDRPECRCPRLLELACGLVFLGAVASTVLAVRSRPVRDPPPK